MFPSLHTISLILAFGSAVVMAIPLLFKRPPAMASDFGETSYEQLERLIYSLYRSWEFSQKTTLLGLTLLGLSVFAQVA